MPFQLRWLCRILPQMCDGKKMLINLWTLLLRSAEILSLLHNGWDLHWKTPKSGGWNHPKSCSRMRPAFDAGCQLGASVSLHRGLSTWLLHVVAPFFTAWCWGARERSPDREDMVEAGSSSQLLSEVTQRHFHGTTLTETILKSYPGSRGGKTDSTP